MEWFSKDGPQTATGTSPGNLLGTMRMHCDYMDLMSPPGDLDGCSSSRITSNGLQLGVLKSSSWNKC